MPHNLNTSEFKASYFEWDLEVEYEVYEPVYGSVEPNSGGLYLGGWPNLPEQIEIRKVWALGPTGKRLDIMPLLDESEIINLEDEIVEKRKD